MPELNLAAISHVSSAGFAGAIRFLGGGLGGGRRGPRRLYDGAIGPYISYIEKFRSEFEALCRS
jgi:hypothetical protein